MSRDLVERALARVIVRIDAHESCDVTVFDGVAHFDPALVGPPGRLHGGLHVVTRTLRVLDALRGDRSASEAPVHLTAMLGKAIPLDTDVVFDGALVRHEDGFSLETRFMESSRLTATARALPAYEAPTWLDRDAIARALGEDARRMRVFDTTFAITKSLCFVDVAPGSQGEAHELGKYVRTDGRLDATWVSAALDTCVAVGMGVIWDNHLFTTQASLHLSAMPITHDRPLVLIAHVDRQEPVQRSTMAPVRVGDRELVTTRVPVTLAWRDDLTPVAHGSFELHPVDHAKFASGSLSPREASVEEER